jgi:hypothetical protein
MWDARVTRSGEYILTIRPRFLSLRRDLLLLELQMAAAFEEDVPQLVRTAICRMAPPQRCEDIHAHLLHAHRTLLGLLRLLSASAFCCTLVDFELDQEPEAASG